MKTKHPLLFILIILCAAVLVPASAGRLPRAADLYGLYPVPEAPLAADPSADPLLRLVNRENPLPSSFKPRVTTPDVKTWKYAEVDLQPVAAAALEALFSAARSEGLSLVAVSGYRSFQTQKVLYARSVERNGEARARQMSAPAGASEHQLGLAMDLSSASLEGDLSSSFARKKEGKWVTKHCAEYGFIIRYKEEWAVVTGYQGEPWHIRYVGPEHARFITKLGVPLETYLDYLSLAYAGTGRPQ